MIAVPSRFAALGLLGLMLAPVPVLAADSARDWLLKMERAARTLDYQGVFVYQHGSRIDSMHIVHKIVDGDARERLVSLSGPRREILRDAQEVRCYYADRNLVVVEPRRAEKREFPGIIPERLRGLDGFSENYEIQLGKSGRVAGRATQLVLIGPRDAFRYGYRLWADRDTGLLLKAELMGDDNQTLEQFVFTQVTIGGNITEEDLLPETEEADMEWRREGSEIVPSGDTDWFARSLPRGFRLTIQMRRDMPLRKKTVDHLVYSDGLATVSVFVEPRVETDPTRWVKGSGRMGAVNVFGTEVEGHHVTTVGEVPAATVTLIGESVARRASDSE